METGPLGQLLSGIGLVITAFCASITLTVITLQQRRKQWIDDFRALYAEFWRDPDVSTVRRWIVSNKEYEGLRDILVRRNTTTENNLDAKDNAELDKVDKFCSIMIRVGTFEKRRMPKDYRLLLEKMFAEFWMNKVGPRDELKFYIKQHWGAEFDALLVGSRRVSLLRRRMYTGPATSAEPLLESGTEQRSGVNKVEA
jgi:hypothetical protein